MLGGHLDSWHSATGATDNAIGCAVMMEAIRILKALGVKPRRTIRVALWGGEEQGLLGSQAYVKEHFGTFEEPKPEFANFAGYFNIDSGTGRARGVGVRSRRRRRRSCARPRPFEDIGFVGVSANQQPPPRRHRHHVVQRGRPARHRPAARTRSSTAPTPGTPTSTPTSGSSRTTRSRRAIVIAAAVYHLAMRDEHAAALPKDKMPARPTR